MEKQKRKVNSKYMYISKFAITVALLCFICVGLVGIALLLPICIEKSDKFFNLEQEIVEDRFTIECSTILNVYHDNELNVTCWETGYSNTGIGLSCIPDAEIWKS